MDITELRYEWRVWGEDLGDVAARLEQLAQRGRVIDRVNVYLVSRRAPGTNAKVRAGTLDIKMLRSVDDGFEQWEPVFKQKSPIPTSVLVDELLPRWRVAVPVPDLHSVTLDELVDKVIEPHPDLASVTVTKRRQMFTFEGCIAELAHVTIGERRLQTACIESTDLDAARNARHLAGLDSAANVNYPLALHRVLGWVGEEE